MTSRPKRQRTRLADAPVAPPTDIAKRKYWTVDEWRAVLEQARQSGLRDEALLLVMYEAALRRAEPGLLRLSYAGRLHEGWLYVWRGKDSRSGYVELTRSTRDVVLRWINTAYPDAKARRSEHFIFPGEAQRRRGRQVSPAVKGLSPRTIYHIVSKLCAYAGVPKAQSHPHALKHSRVMHLLEAAQHDERVDPGRLYQTIANLVGHRTAKTTILHYASQTGAERSLALKLTKELVR